MAKWGTLTALLSAWCVLYVLTLSVSSAHSVPHDSHNHSESGHEEPNLNINQPPVASQKGSKGLRPATSSPDELKPTMLPPGETREDHTSEPGPPQASHEEEELDPGILEPAASQESHEDSTPEIRPPQASRQEQNTSNTDSQERSSHEEHDHQPKIQPPRAKNRLGQNPQDSRQASPLSSQKAAGNAGVNGAWHAHVHALHLFNTTAKLDSVAYGESEYFIRKVVWKYGRRGVLSLEGLARLMENLGLVGGVEDSRSHSDENTGGSQRGMADKLGRRSGSEKRKRKRRKLRSVSEDVTHIHDSHSECYDAPDLLEAFHFEGLRGLDPAHFLLFCPALIDQLDNDGCRRYHSNHAKLDGDDSHATEEEWEDEHEHDHSSQTHHRDHDVDESSMLKPAVEVKKESTGIPVMVWVYSSIAVLVISLVGLLGVAVIPVMRRVFYASLLQFLVALAVGALCGDALLHLLPHALVSGGHPHGKKDSPGEHHHADVNDSDHQVSPVHETEDKEAAGDHDPQAVWKGLVALSGLVFFFLAERVLTIVTARRAKKKLEKKKREKTELMKTTLSTKQHTMLLPEPSNPNADFFEDTPIRETVILDDDDDDESDNNHSFIGKNNNDKGRHNHDDDHHHGHGHGHSHHHGEMPGSVSAVAWMVIMGDGIHNLSDGLAIGAAFASSITGGFSTAVAVFCHELPHEIGDFAMLLKAGMPAKQALMYNIVSSVLCFFGMVIGVLLGQVDSASSWIFCAVAGMFLYISLADMLPQLTATEAGAESSECGQLLLQCAGIALGSGIMLCIAVFEEDLKTLME